MDKIVGEGAEAIWVSTFHSSCVRILRRFIDRLGYDTNFTIYDARRSENADEAGAQENACGSEAV